MRRAGELRHRITIQQMTATTDASGNRTEAWTEFYTCSAKIEPRGGRELFQADRVSADLTHDVTIRYKAGILPAMRVLYADPKNALTERHFEIRATFAHKERREWLMLICRELD